MFLKYLMAFSTALLFFSCKSTLQDSATLDDGQSWEVKRLSSPLIVFNWSRDGGELENHLSNQIDKAAKMNRDIASGIKKFPPLAAKGMGLYFANDPILSYGFGNELSCLEVKENTEILKAKDPILSDLEKSTAVKQSEPVLIYSWGEGLIPSEEGGSTSGVIRDRSVIDLRRSRKFDFSKGAGEEVVTSVKLDERALRRAESSLSSGRFCEAIQVFENNLPALYYSSIAGAKAIRPLPKNEKLKVSSPSRSLLRLLNFQVSSQADLILNDKGPYLKIRQDLIDLKLVEKDEMDGAIDEKVNLTILLGDILNVNENDDWSAKKILVLTQLLNLTKLLTLPEGISNVKELSTKIREALDTKIVNWSKENPKDFEFSKKLWKHWYDHSISNFVSRK